MSIMSRRYNYEQASRVVKNIERILTRINRANYPCWLITELHDANHNAQCIQGEYKCVMIRHGDGV